MGLISHLKTIQISARISAHLSLNGKLTLIETLIMRKTSYLLYIILAQIPFGVIHVAILTSCDYTNKPVGSSQIPHTAISQLKPLETNKTVKS